MHVEATGVSLPSGIREGVRRASDGDVREPDLFQDFLPACARQAASNSGGPEIDVSEGSFRHRPSVSDIGELEAAPRPKDTENLVKRRALVGAEIDHAIADDDVGPAGFDGQLLGQTLAELDVGRL